jgi:hypothetical protein
LLVAFSKPFKSAIAPLLTVFNKLSNEQKTLVINRILEKTPHKQKQQKSNEHTRKKSYFYCKSCGYNEKIPNKKFIVVINDRVEYNEDIFKLMQNTLKTNIGRFNVIQSLEDSIELDEGFKHAKNGWSVFLKQGQNINTNFAAIIHKRINFDMKRFLYSENKDGTKMVVQSALYKLLNGNRPLMNQEGEPDTRSFKEKLQDMQQTDMDSVIEWEILFDE